MNLSNKNIYVYFSTNYEKYHRETLISIKSLLDVSQSKINILLVTDNIFFFKKYLESELVNITFIEVDDTKINLMKGDINFIHRVKIEVILKAFAQGFEKVLYLDSDTIVTKDLNEIFCKIDSENSFMHIKEFNFNDEKLDSFDPTNYFKKTILENQFINPLNNTPIGVNFFSSNAGVIGLHKSHINLIQSVLKLTDEIFPITKHHATEQFMFSYILQKHTQLNYCNHYVYHYWESIKKEVVEIFFDKIIFQKKFNPKELICSIENHELVLQNKVYQYFYEAKINRGLLETMKLIFKGKISVDFIKNVIYLFKSEIKKIFK